jgi:integrase
MAVSGKFHILRHTFCTHLAAQGVPPLHIKELAGHSSLKTTEKYMHILPGAKESGIALLESAAQRKCWQSVKKHPRTARDPGASPGASNTQ